MKKFVIRKNEMSSSYYSEIRDFGRYFCSLVDLLIIYGGKVVHFDSKSNAQTFIKENDLGEAFVCEMEIGVDSVKIFTEKEEMG